MCICKRPLRQLCTYEKGGLITRVPPYYAIALLTIDYSYSCSSLPDPRASGGSLCCRRVGWPYESKRVDQIVYF